MWMVPEGKRTKVYSVADPQMEIKSEDCNPHRVSTSFRHCFNVSFEPFSSMYYPYISINVKG